MPNGSPHVIDLLRHPWARIVLEILGIVVLFWLIGRLSEVLTPLLIGLATAYTLDPVVGWVSRRGCSRRMAVSLVFGCFLTAILVLIAWGIPRIWKESGVLYKEAMIGDAFRDVNGDGHWQQGEPLTRDLYGDGVYHEAWFKRMHRAMLEHGLIEPHPRQGEPENALSLSGSDTVPSAPTSGPALTPATTAVPATAASASAVPGPPVEGEPELDFDPVIWLKQKLRSFATAYQNGDHHLADKSIVVLRRAGFYLLAIVLIPIYAYFFSLHLPQVSRTIIEHVPSRHRTRVLHIFAEINQAVGAFFRGRVLICLILSVVASTGFAIAHVPSWLVLGILMGVSTAIPMAPLLLMVPACGLLYLSSAEPWQYYVAALTWASVQGLEHVLLLVIMGKGVEIHPVLIIVSVLAFGTLFGAPGVLLAVPLAATARILVREFVYPALRQMAGLGGGTEMVTKPPPPPPPPMSAP